MWLVRLHKQKKDVCLWTWTVHVNKTKRTEIKQEKYPKVYTLAQIASRTRHPQQAPVQRRQNNQNIRRTTNYYFPSVVIYLASFVTSVLCLYFQFENHFKHLKTMGCRKNRFKDIALKEEKRRDFKKSRNMKTRKRETRLG